MEKDGNEDQIEVDTLTRTPVCFLVIGKPGAGKTTLAKCLSDVWNCKLISGQTTIEQVMNEETPLGKEAKARLLSGEELDEPFIAQMMIEALNSEGIKHYGYVLDGIPSTSDSWKSLSDQLDTIKSLNLSPDVIINLKITDQDLIKRRVGQRVDPVTNKLFTRDVYSPESHSAGGEASKEGEDGEDDDDEEEEVDDGGEGDKESGVDDQFRDDLVSADAHYDATVEAAERLVHRPQDLPKTVEGQIQHYKENVLRQLEEFIIQHNQQYVIELDANLAPKELFKSLLMQLNDLGLPRSPVPKRLVDPEEEEEEPEGIDTEQFLQQLAETGILLPKFRWRRSRWGRYCPVQLAQGNMTPGRMEFSVGFLDKMYSMSSAEVLGQFIRSPQTYLLPPNPLIPCKVCVVGPPTSGKSTLSGMIAEKYNAMVLDIQTLLKPVMERARQSAIEDAKQEAENTAINTITTQLAAQQATQDDGHAAPPVTADHPDVMRAVSAAVEKASTSSVEISQEMYMEALKDGIKSAHQKRRESNPDRPRFGGWVVDGFPLTRENWAAMIESDLLPDFVISLEDVNAPEDTLLARFTKLKGLPDPASLKAAAAAAKKKEETEIDSGEQSATASLPDEVVQWQKSRADYDRQWGQLSASIKGSAIDPLTVDCSGSTDQALESAVALMEGVFTYKPVEFSAMEDDADADDDPVLDPDAEEDDGEDELVMRQRKPWGDTAHFCPVALAEKGVLWPGNQDTAARYRERLYYFSTEEMKELFLSNPQRFVSKTKPLQPPPIRLFLLGPKGAGKTTVGRDIAAKLGVFHVGFREYLQEQILPKMKKPPLIDDDEWEHEEENEGMEDDEDDGKGDLDADVKVELNEEEAEIRAYLLHGEALSEETIEKYATTFWQEEPYRSTGFIMEGFPYGVDELRFLGSKGLFPDATVIFQVEESDVLKRLLPGKMEVWKRKRDKRLERKRKAKEKKVNEWEADKTKRKAELTAEYEEKVAAKKAGKAEKEGDDDEDDDLEEGNEDLEEYQEQMVEIDEEEFPDEEDEEEEESEPDATERITTSITEKHEEINDAISNLQDVLLELQIPYHSVNASRSISVVTYSFNKAIQPYTVDRQGLLSKCTAVTGEMAKKLLDHGYKQLSKFKRWCPVKLMEDPSAVLPPVQQLLSQQFPVIYKQYVVYLSSSAARDQFMGNPEKYFAQTPPGPGVPVRLAILGPPKSGKSTVATRFAKEYGCVRLSIGEALRRVVTQFPNSKLTELIQAHLRAGQTVPEDLCVHALERALMDVECRTRGYILDGWPLTKAQVDLLSKFCIVPVCIVQLKVSEQEMLRRGDLDRNSPTRTQPLHDSTAILLVRSSHYYKHVEAVKKWYTQEHDNWHTVDGQASKWWVWQTVRGHALTSACQIQQYMANVNSGKAASIAGLCITSSEFKTQLGEFSQYCPVSLAFRNELVDCSDHSSLTFAAEYQNRYYVMSNQEDLETFLSTPDVFVLPGCPRELPPVELLPAKRSHADVKTLFPKQFEIQGYCPVSYVDGNKRYESLVPGVPDLAAEYKNKLYCFSSEKNLEKFMRQPDHYEVTVLPTKLPPLKQPMPVTSLPMLGYLEQSVATAIINALSAVGIVKPKFPFITSTKSSLIYVAYHLKAFNPKSSQYVRQKYKKKLLRFEEQCRLIDYLSTSMSPGYQDPACRPLDFKHKMGSFLKLKDCTTIAV